MVNSRPLSLIKLFQLISPCLTLSHLNSAYIIFAELSNQWSSLQVSSAEPSSGQVRSAQCISSHLNSSHYLISSHLISSQLSSAHLNTVRLNNFNSSHLFSSQLSSYNLSRVQLSQAHRRSDQLSLAQPSYGQLGSAQFDKTISTHLNLSHLVSSQLS